MSPKLSAAVLAAGIALLPGGGEARATQDAQEGLSRRVEQAPDGEVRFQFAARPGVCGHEDGISIRDEHRPGEGRSVMNWRSGWDEDECEVGPVHVALRVAGGRVLSADTRVASPFPARSGRVTELGTVPAAEAARYLVALAGRADDGDLGEDVLLPVNLAEGVEPWPDMLRLAREESLPAETRKSAVFWLSQAENDEAGRALAGLARARGLDREVREQAVFWLGQSQRDEALEVLEEILRDEDDRELQKKAVFALSQHRSARASALLREYAERPGGSGEVRQDAIFWLGQTRSSENAAYLQDLFRRLDDPELKDKVIFSLSQMRGVGSERWLLEVARDGGEPMETRKQALFWAGQSGASLADLARLYDAADDVEIKEQLIFVFSQRRDDAAVEKLIDIVRRDPDRELRRKALFWLGQSRDPRALRVITELIEEP
ncbi:MAG TPA: HEAT repeat domain-containing protein [Longimicrobiaceae bacterium]|nr:HEAT repeat domain-containing protein [Longimicrobiaceae bacterium]